MVCLGGLDISDGMGLSIVKRKRASNARNASKQNHQFDTLLAAEDKIRRNRKDGEHRRGSGSQARLRDWCE